MIRLSDHIAAAGGWLSLEAFMQLALHHPEEGYYSTAIENKIGRASCRERV